MENYILYIALCIMLIILPGPDTAIVTKNTLTIDRIAGLKTMAGTLCALMIHTTMAVVGLSAILVKSAIAFSIIKYVGAIYLVYLGVRTLLAMRKRKAPTVDAIPDQKANSSFLQGFFTNLLNPKVAVFFLTFLPQFVSSGTNPLIPFLLLGITYTVLTFVWFIFYVSLLHKVRQFMNRPSTQKVMEGLTGIVLVGFGIKLAFEKN